MYKGRSRLVFRALSPPPPPALSINSLFCLQKSPSLLKQCLTAGTAACFADLVTFPLDTVKVRQQMVEPPLDLLDLSGKLHSD